METVLIFHEGLELPDFASFVLLDDEAGSEALRTYFRRFLAIGREHGIGVLLDTPTWRASPDWGERLGYSRDRLTELNRRGVALLEGLRAETSGDPPLLISGCIGPRGDGYVVGEQMPAAEAERYHSFQAEVVRRYGRRRRQRADADVRGRGGRDRAGRAQGGPPGRRSPSRSRPTDGCPAVRPSARRSSTSTPRLTALLPTSWSIAPTRRTSPPRSSRRTVDRPAARHPRERIQQEPCRAGRGGDARRGRPGRARRGLSRAERATAGAERLRRLLRHRPPPRRGDRRRGHSVTTYSNDAHASSAKIVS